MLSPTCIYIYTYTYTPINIHIRSHRHAYALSRLNEDLVWFLCLRAYQPLWVIKSQSHPCRRRIVTYLTHSRGDKDVHTFTKGICLKMNVIASKWREKSERKTWTRKLLKIDSPIPDKRSDTVVVNQKRKEIVDFTAPINHRVKRTEKLNRYTDSWKGYGLWWWQWLQSFFRAFGTIGKNLRKILV